MNPSDIGKILVNAHDEIASLKKKLDGISGSSNQDSKETQQIFQRLNYTIKKFENSIQNNVDRILTHNMTHAADPSSQAQGNGQKFPQILSRTSSGRHNSKQGLHNMQNYAPVLDSDHEPFYLRQQKRYQRQISSNGGSNSILKNDSSSAWNSTKHGEFQLQKLANKSFEIGRAIISSSNQNNNNNNHISFEIPKRQKSASVHLSNSLNESRIVGKSTERTRKIKAGRISKAASVLPAEIRNNPFADPIAITESEIYCGLYNLINQGIVPKDVDIMPAFIRGVPPLLNKPAKMHEFKEKLVKQEINIDIPMDLLSLKLDILPSSQKAENINIENDTQATRQTIQPNRKSLKMKAFMPIGITEKEQMNKSMLNKNSASDYKESILNLQEGVPKSYPEVLDTYSLHHLIVRKGKVLEETPEFTSYKRIFAIQWGSINRLFKEFEIIATQFEIPMFNVDGKKLDRIPGRMFLGDKGKMKAIVKIQALIRGFLQRREFERVQKTIQTVKIIQKYIRLWLKKKSTQLMIQMKNQQQRDIFRQSIEKFKLDWPEIKLKTRFEIHINSFSFDEMKRLTMDKQLQRENIQITRIFNIRDPLVSIIYVCPFDLSDDITNYYYKILELGEVVNFKERLFFIKPENCDKLPHHLSLSKKLLYSPGALKRVRRLIKNKNAYMVPGFPSNEDIKLASELQIPIMGGDPQTSYVNSTKSAARRVFNSCGVDVPVGAFEIYDEIEFINTLTILITNNPEIRTWIFKMDDEFSGRGIAYLNLDSVPSLLEIATSLQGNQADHDVITRIKGIISQSLPTKIKIAIPSLYRDYREYLSGFLKRGGTIEAFPIPKHRGSTICSPSISFFISPTGETQIISTFDKIQGNPFINISSQFPQNSISPQIDVIQTTNAIAKSLYQKGLFGYVTADFLAIEDQLYGIGIDCFMTNYLSSFFYFDYLMRGVFDPVTGKYYVNQTDQNASVNTLLSGRDQEERTYLYCPFVNHPGLVNVKIKNFFQMCRYEAIQFDLEKKFGATFLLVDVLQAGGLGVLTIGENDQASLNLMNLALGFLMKQAGPVNKNYSDSIGSSRSDSVSIVDVISRIRILVKKLTKRQAPLSHLASGASKTPSNLQK